MKKHLINIFRLIYLTFFFVICAILWPIAFIKPIGTKIHKLMIKVIDFDKKVKLFS